MEAAIAEWSDGLKDHLLGTSTLTTPTPWVPGLHVIAGVVDFTAGNPLPYTELDFHFVPFSPNDGNGQTKFKDGAITYIATADGTVTVWQDAPDQAKKKLQTLTLDGWDFHHVILIQVKTAHNGTATRGSPPRLVIVSPSRDQYIPQLAENYAADTESRPATPQSELKQLVAENAALSQNNKDLIVALNEAIARGDGFEKAAEAAQLEVEALKHSSKVSEAEYFEAVSAKVDLENMVEKLTSQLDAASAERNAAVASAKSSPSKKTRSSTFSGVEEQLLAAETAIGSLGSAELQAELDTLITELRDSKNELAETQAAMAAMSKKHDDDLELCHSGMDVMEHQLADAKAILTTAEMSHGDTVDGLQEEISTKEKRVSELELGSDTADVVTGDETRGSIERVAELEQQVADAKMEAELCKTGMDVLEHQLADAKAIIAATEMQHQDQLEHSHTGIDVLEHQLADAKAIIMQSEMSHGDTIYDLQEEISTKEARVSELELAAPGDAGEGVAPAPGAGPASSGSAEDIAALVEELAEVKKDLADTKGDLELSHTGIDVLEHQVADAKAIMFATEMQHHDQLEHSHTGIDVLEHQLADAKAIIMQSEMSHGDTIYDLQEEISTKSARVSELEDDSTSNAVDGVASSEQVAVLEVALEEARAELTAAKTETEAVAAEAQAQIAAAATQVKDLEDKAARLDGSGSEAEVKIEQLGGRLKEAEAETLSHKTQAGELETAAAKANEMHAAAEAEANELKEQLAAHLAASKAVMAKLKDAKDEAEGNAAAHATEAAAAADKIAASEAEVATLTEQLATHTQAANEATEKHAAAETEASKLQARLGTLEGSSTENADKIAALEAELVGTTEAKQAADTELAEHKAKVAELSTQLEASEAAKAAADDDVGTHRLKAQELAAQLEASEAAKAATETAKAEHETAAAEKHTAAAAEATALQAQLDSLGETSKADSDKSSALEAELVTAKETLEQAEVSYAGNVSKMLANIQTAEGRCAELKAQLDAATAAQVEAEGKLGVLESSAGDTASLKAELAEVTSAKEYADEKFEAAEDKIVELEEELAAAGSSSEAAGTLETELVGVNAQLEAAAKKLDAEVVMRKAIEEEHKELEEMVELLQESNAELEDAAAGGGGDSDDAAGLKAQVTDLEHKLTEMQGSLDGRIQEVANLEEQVKAAAASPAAGGDSTKVTRLDDKTLETNVHQLATRVNACEEALKLDPTALESRLAGLADVDSDAAVDGMMASMLGQLMQRVQELEGQPGGTQTLGKPGTTIANGDATNGHADDQPAGDDIAAAGEDEDDEEDFY